MERLAETARYAYENSAERIVSTRSGNVEAAQSALSRLADFRRTGVTAMGNTNGRPSYEQIRKFKSQLGFVDLC